MSKDGGELFCGTSPRRNPILPPVTGHKAPMCICPNTNTQMSISYALIGGSPLADKSGFLSGGVLARRGRR